MSKLVYSFIYSWIARVIFLFFLMPSVGISVSRSPALALDPDRNLYLPVLAPIYF